MTGLINISDEYALSMDAHLHVVDMSFACNGSCVISKAIVLNKFIDIVNCRVSHIFCWIILSRCRLGRYMWLSKSSFRIKLQSSIWGIL